ncbi:MAG: hypothetical protein ABJN36_18400 [Cyclobacteriaceae bacterium]
MNTNFNAQRFVYEIFEEDQLTKLCIQNVLRNIDRNIEKAGNDKAKISRLLMMRSHVESQLPGSKPAAYTRTSQFEASLVGA